MIPAFTDATWEREVLAAGRPLGVFFWAPWCVPSRLAREELEGLSGGLALGTLDVEDNPRTAEQNRIQGLPTLLVFRGGQETERRVGRMSREDLAQFLGRHA